MPSKVLVIILQGETRDGDSNVEDLKKVFSDISFDTRVYNPKIPEAVKATDNDWIVDNYRMLSALSYARSGPVVEGKRMEYWKESPVLVVRDSSVCNLTSPTEMGARVQKMVHSGNSDHMILLCTWNDECDKYVNSKVTGLKWTSHPTTTQAILYRPEWRDATIDLLKKSTIPLTDEFAKLISRGTLRATAVTPNLIDYDLSLATKDEDYAKANRCKLPERLPPIKKKRDYIWAYLLFALLVVAVLIILFFVPRSKSDVVVGQQN